MAEYQPSYFAALNHLIEYGSDPAHAERGRLLIAAALRGLRRVHSRERVRREYRHMFYVCPFPEAQS